MLGVVVVIVIVIAVRVVVRGVVSQGSRTLEVRFQLLLQPHTLPLLGLVVVEVRRVGSAFVLSG